MNLVNVLAQQIIISEESDSDESEAKKKKLKFNMKTNQPEQCNFTKVDQKIKKSKSDLPTKLKVTRPRISIVRNSDVLAKRKATELMSLADFSKVGLMSFKNFEEDSSEKKKVSFVGITESPMRLKIKEIIMEDEEKENKD